MQTAPVEERLDHLAIQMADMAFDLRNDTSYEALSKLREFVRDHAYSLSEFAVQVREEYARVHGLEDEEVPTRAQGLALVRFLRPQFRTAQRGDQRATVCRGGMGLPDNYVVVQFPDGCTGGIHPDGSVST